MSIESETYWHVTSTYQVAVPGEPHKALIPCPSAANAVRSISLWPASMTVAPVRYRPRRDRDASGGDDATGTVHLEDQPWPHDPVSRAVFPDSWIAGWFGDRSPATSPARLSESPSTAPILGGIAATYVPSPFRFCFRCKVSYEQTRGNDFAKLASLDAEGRSSAVSVVSNFRSSVR